MQDNYPRKIEKTPIPIGELTIEKIEECLSELFYKRQEDLKNKRRTKVWFLGTRKQLNKIMFDAMQTIK